ncbi:MAG: sigma-70 family RNA polymerase sigma factor [Acutalibacteraceae bacterium]
MNRQEAERIVTEYLKPVFGFALKRCRSLQDAEDLSQEIVTKVFLALMKRDDIEDMPKFIWTVAHNCLSNYYRDNCNSFVGVSLDDVAESLCNSHGDISSTVMKGQEIVSLQSEIAYLSKLQRRIVIAYYYENKKQSDIAEELNIPVGTVKWHLFQAKKELKRGMETVRQPGELKFHPIQFDMCTFSGKIGTKGDISHFFRSAISQNIAYAVRKEAKSVHEIAEELGVSPVYIESETEYLEQYGFLLKRKDKYLGNILIYEPTEELNRMHDEMYSKAAKIFANELYDELVRSDILQSSGIMGGYSAKITMTGKGERDNNFLLWSLVPYIAACSGEGLTDHSIAFSDVYTIRPDGGKNICYASVASSDVKPPMYHENMKQFRGPFWNGLTDKITLWTIDSEWSAKRISDRYQLTVVRDLTLLNRYLHDDLLSEEDYAYLAEQGYIAVCGEADSLMKSALRIVYIRDEQTKQNLLSFGNRIKDRHKEEFDRLKAPYIHRVLDQTPKHLQKMRMYGLQYLFDNDAWFILHCLKELVDNGKLALPREDQKQAITTVLFHQ